jgi:phosphatidylglycerophosphatase A
MADGQRRNEALDEADKRLQEALRDRGLIDERPVESSDPTPEEVLHPPHKNKARAALRPLDSGTLALSVFGLGFLRPAPGTWGSVPPVALATVLMLSGTAWWVHQVVLGAVLVVSSVACVAFGRYAESRFGRKDAAEVVADETAGQCLALMLWPAGLHAGGAFTGFGEGASVGSALIGPFLAMASAAFAFVAFRTSDIIKPWPARTLEKLPYGWGVLIDDLVAGLYAAILVWIVVWGGWFLSGAGMG